MPYPVSVTRGAAARAAQSNDDGVPADPGDSAPVPGRRHRVQHGVSHRTRRRHLARPGNRLARASWRACSPSSAGSRFSFSREHIAGIRAYTLFYLRWRVRALSYLMLLEDQLSAARRCAVSRVGDRRRSRRAARSALGRAADPARHPALHRAGLPDDRVVDDDDRRVVRDPVPAATRKGCTASASAACSGSCGSKPTCSCSSTNTHPFRSTRCTGQTTLERDASPSLPNCDLCALCVSDVSSGFRWLSWS